MKTGEKRNHVEGVISQSRSFGQEAGFDSKVTKSANLSDFIRNLKRIGKTSLILLEK